jgi:hypothetical protein
MTSRATLNHGIFYLEGFWEARKESPSPRSSRPLLEMLERSRWNQDGFVDVYSRRPGDPLMTEGGNFDKIVSTYRQFADVEKYAHRAPIAEIRDENDFNLNIPRYVDTFEEEEEIDIAAVQKEIGAIEGLLAETRAKMAGYLKELGLHGSGGDA